MFKRRRLLPAAVAVACLILAAGASADPLDTFTGAAAPSHVKPSTSQSYTISLTSDPSAPNRAQRATIGIPAGFSDPLSVQATTTAVLGFCDASTWDAVIADQQLQLQRPGNDTNALCPGATLTVTFVAESAAAEGTYAWTSELHNETSGAFTLSGPQPSVVVDGTPPTATITGKPSNPSNDSGPTFVFSADEPATFECKLDGAEFTPCSSPQTSAELTDGSHTFALRATDTAGNLSGPTSFSWTIDTAAPTAMITGKPSDPTKVTAASFTFHSSEGNSSFLCRLDDGAFESCASPKNYSALGDGSHSFEVKATDQAGNTGGVDAFTWTIDTVAPTASLSANPPNPSAESSASFSFVASETDTSFSCSLDGAPFASCVSVKTYEALADGSHTFAVRATDAAGNIGAPAGYTWTIDTAAPTAAITQAPSDPSNVTALGFGFTSSESNSTFLCRLDGEAFEPCASPKSYSGLADGPHTFVVKAIDSVGNPSAEANHSWTIDTVAPTATITGPPSDPSNDTSPSFSFSTSESGSDLACKLDGGAFAACNSPKSYPALAEGSHTFAVQATDAAGNTGPADSYTWTIDTAAPTATITQAPSDPSNVTTPSFGFTASEPGSTFSCQLDGGTPEPCASPKPYTGLVAGAHTFVVKAMDSAGNLSAGASFSWTVDTLAPTAAIGQRPNDPSKVTAPTFTFTASEGGSSFLCRLDAQPFSSCDSPKEYTGLGQGLHTFQVKATDPAGNTGEETAYAWMIDTVAPTTTLTDKPNNPTNESSAAFKFAANEPSSFACKRDNQAFEPCGPTKTYSGLLDGPHTFVVKAVDSAGNPGETSYGWTIDTEPPAAQITQKPASPSNVNAPSFTFTSSEAAGTFECRLEQGGFAPCASPRSYGPLTDGQHAFSVRATDLANNTGAAATHTWTIDTVAPAASITAKPNNPSNSSSPSFSFTANENESTFACRLDAGPLSACTSPTSYGGLGDGPHTFRVRATDPAGNTGLETTHTWTIETRAPTAALISGPSGLSNSSAATFAFSADEPSSFDCSLDGRGFEPCNSPATYHALGDGAHAFSVRAKDAVGNLSAPVGHSWAVDTTAPETRLAAAPTSGTATTATFSFAATEGASFECRLDGAPFALCGSPRTYASLTRGDHQFEVRAIDAAGNADATPSLHGWKITAPAAKKVASALLSPRAGARTKRPPLLVWRKTNRARYYNVQVYRGNRKVLTAWPTRARLQLKAQWRYLGRKQRLRPGNYRWFVWPGYGVPSARNYGALLGQSTFVVTRR